MNCGESGALIGLCFQGWSWGKVPSLTTIDCVDQIS
jgi:hypothetical protein